MNGRELTNNPAHGEVGRPGGVPRNLWQRDFSMYLKAFHETEIDNFTINLDPHWLITSILFKIVIGKDGTTLPCLLVTTHIMISIFLSLLQFVGDCIGAFFVCVCV